MHDDLNRIAAPLVAWYQKAKRPLPWRSDRAPYHVWISEIMLQQTRIEAVLGYYARFMQALPDLASLAAVPEEQLLKLWEGLGYYSRARNLKKAAVMIMDEYGGRFPESYDALLKLPGIGAYTAAAIASICFNEKVPAVDGNVLRVITRITGSRENVLLEKTKKDVGAALKEIMPNEAGDFNEGLMELGETLCLPNGLPRCGECPLQAFCKANKERLTEEIPVRIKTAKRKKEEKTVLLIQTADGETALEKRQEKGLLSGLYQLPNLNGFLTEAEITALCNEWGLQPRSVTFDREGKHIFTHIEWKMKCWRVRVKARGGSFFWASKEELHEAYALPTAFKKFTE